MSRDRLLEMVDDCKEKLTSEEYRNLVEEIARLSPTDDPIVSSNEQFEDVHAQTVPSFHTLTSLPPLPETLIQLYCVSNQITSLPSLPNPLELYY